mgnify:FL=1
MYKRQDTDDDLVNQMFGLFVRDFSSYATELFGKPSNSGRQQKLIQKFIRAPVADQEQFDKVWTEHVFALKGRYRMKD